MLGQTKVGFRSHNLIRKDTKHERHRENELFIKLLYESGNNGKGSYIGHCTNCIDKGGHTVVNAVGSHVDGEVGVDPGETGRGKDDKHEVEENFAVSEDLAEGEGGLVLLIDGDIRGEELEGGVDEDREEAGEEVEGNFIASTGHGFHCSSHGGTHHKSETCPGFHLRDLLGNIIGPQKRHVGKGSGAIRRTTNTLEKS